MRRGKPSRAPGGGHAPPKTSGSGGHAGACPSGAPEGARTSSGLQQEPHGSRGSLEDPMVLGLVKRPEAPARSVMVRPDAEGGSARGNERRRKPPRRSGSDVLRRGLGRSGTTAVEPGWRGSSVLASAELSDLVFLRVRGCGAPQTRGRSGCGNAPRPLHSKELREREPQERQRT